MGAKDAGKSIVRRFRLGCALPRVLTLSLPLAPPWFTQFVNLVSGSNLAVRRGLQPVTDAVQAGGAFHLDGHRVVLIDTPGFDDTTKSDTDILKMIAAFLQQSYVKLRHGLKNGDCAFLTKHAPMCRYKQGTTLAGVLYFHAISDDIMSGISMRNFDMLRKLCGDDTLKNMVIVANWWGEVDREVGEAREAELAREDILQARSGQGCSDGSSQRYH
jgi:hypothetical protein